jgi:phage shock protein PspC (stress-responsive transcriptional regulator)
MSTDWSSTGPTQTPAPAPTPTQRFFAWTRRLGLVRPAGDRVLGGVSAALARRLGIGSGWMRVILVALVLFAGLSLWFYAIAWSLLPDERTGTIPLERWIS